MEKLTAIIPTFNEEHNIVEAIKSVDFADEIIVDSFSKDKTVELATPLAKGYKKRVYQFSQNCYSSVQHSWILLLDADEGNSRTETGGC